MIKALSAKTQLNNQRGIGLMETLVAVAILGTSVAAFVVSLSAGSLTANELNRETIAQGLAQTQMEYIKNSVFNDTYNILPVPATYSVSVDVREVDSIDDPNIQKIIVTVQKDGEEVLTVTNYKVNKVKP